MLTYVESRRLGVVWVSPLGVILSDITIGRALEGTPTLTVEVLSPSTPRVVTRATGATAVALPPFSDLALIPDALWPAP